MSVIAASKALAMAQQALQQQNLWSVQQILPSCLNAIDDLIRNHSGKGMFTTGYADAKWVFHSLIESDTPLQRDHNDSLCEDLDDAIENVLVHRGYRYTSTDTNDYEEWRFRISWSE